MLKKKLIEVEANIAESEAQIQPMKTNFEAAKSSYDKTSAGPDHKRKAIEAFEENMRVLDAEFEEKQGSFWRV